MLIVALILLCLGVVTPTSRDVNGDWTKDNPGMQHVQHVDRTGQSQTIAVHSSHRMPIGNSNTKIPHHQRHSHVPQSPPPPPFPVHQADPHKPFFTYNDLIHKRHYPRGGYFHIYDPHISYENEKESNCNRYYDEHKAMDFPSIVKDYNLWSGLVGQERMRSLSPNDTIFGLKFALDTIWKHQHPPDCRKAKFLIPTKHNGGFGSELHVLTNPLGLAMDLGRIYLSNPYLNEGSEWEVNNDFCHNQTKVDNNRYGFHCYYEPWSNCTVYDALGDNAMDILLKWKKDKYRNIRTMDVPVIQIEKNEIEHLYSDRYRQHLLRIVGEKKTAIIHMVQRLGGKYIPRVLRDVVNCSPMISQFHYYWWRAITMAYFMRPNEATRKWIENHRIKAAEEGIAQNNMVAIYVRRGDKDIEMRLSPIEEYIDGFSYLWTKGYMNDTISLRHIFVASESSEVIQQMKNWQKDNKKMYRIHFTDVFDRKGLFAEKSRSERNAGVPVVHHPEEYLSMLLNIHYLIQANGWVCTMSSNFCRIVDELRATISARAGAPFMDLSIEKCTHPPCLFGGFYDLDW